ncbi:hypothetical protein ABIF97_000015 [Bradyrhizobium japonicum]
MLAAKGRFAFALGLIVGFPGFADAQQYDGSYNCVAEFSGGVAYDEVSKKWDSARFRPSDKLIVRFKYLGPTLCGGQDCYSDQYLVSITPSGSDKASVCKDYKGSEKIQFTRDVGRGDCEANYHRYTFGLKYKRFLSTYEFGGYAIGMDQKTDTPSITGGSCTKIQQ